MSHAWHENEDTLGYSEDHAPSLGLRKMSKKGNRIRSESHFGSLGSNLNQLGAQGPLEVNKMFLTDEYFSDVNPRSMRRLMNVIYVMGRLLKAFSIDFNWHHLASWANITEQWPYHTSWIILFVENYGDKFEDSMSLKQIYDIVYPHIPTQKEIEPLIELDRDKKKLDVFLTLNKKTLTVADIKVYMPFTINLDPFLRKVIKEEVQNMEAFGLTLVPESKNCSATQDHKAMLTRRQAAKLSRKMGESGVTTPGLLAPSLVPPYMGLKLPNPEPMTRLQLGAGGETQARKIPLPRPVLPRELQGLVLSSLNLEQVSVLIRTIEGINSSMVDTYCYSVVSSNITGQVLLHCQVAELKSVLNMNFGDWELFKLVLTGMRDDECNNISRTPAKAEAPKETEAISQPRKKSHYEKQVAMEQAAVSGLLSTLNEDAKEDILNVELDDAIEAAAEVTNFDYQVSQEKEESDYIYYSHPVQGFKVFSEDEVMVAADMEGGQSGERRWSAASSLAGSFMELDAIVHQASTPPGSAGKSRPNADEYQEFSKSHKNSPYSSVSGSLCLSDESDSQEQQTIARRPDGVEAGRPTVQNIFPEATSKAEVLGPLIATLPDGSKMTSSK